jgi:hypothetical protein
MVHPTRSRIRLPCPFRHTSTLQHHRPRSIATTATWAAATCSAYTRAPTRTGPRRACSRPARRTARTRSACAPSRSRRSRKTPSRSAASKRSTAPPSSTSSPYSASAEAVTRRTPSSRPTRHLGVARGDSLGSGSCLLPGHRPQEQRGEQLQFYASNQPDHLHPTSHAPGGRVPPGRLRSHAVKYEGYPTRASENRPPCRFLWWQAPA